MDLTLLILSVASVVIAVTTIVLLVVVLRHLGRHRRELAALRATAEAHDAETSGGGAQGGSSETSEASAEGDSLRRVAVVLNPSKFEETDTFRRKITDAVQRIEGAEVVFYETSIDDPGKGQTEQAVADGADLVMAAAWRRDGAPGRLGAGRHRHPDGHHPHAAPGTCWPATSRSRWRTRPPRWSPR